MTAQILSELIYTVTYVNEDGESWTHSFKTEEEQVAYAMVAPEMKPQMGRVERYVADDPIQGIAKGSELWAVVERYNKNDWIEGQLWERVGEGLIHEDLSFIAHAVKARKRAGLKLHVTPFSSRF